MCLSKDWESIADFDDVGMKLFSLMNIIDPSDIQEMLETHGIPFTNQGTSLTKQPRTADLGTNDESVPGDAFKATPDEIQTAVRRDIRNSKSHKLRAWHGVSRDISVIATRCFTHCCRPQAHRVLTFDLKFGSITKGRAEITDCTGFCQRSHC